MVAQKKKEGGAVADQVLLVPSIASLILLKPKPTAVKA